MDLLLLIIRGHVEPSLTVPMDPRLALLLGEPGPEVLTKPSPAFLETGDQSQVIISEPIADIEWISLAMCGQWQPGAKKLFSGGRCQIVVAEDSIRE